MEAMAIRAFSVFLLLSLGGFRPALTQVVPLQNVTEKVGNDAIIECRTGSSGNTNQPYWSKYNPQQTNIYDPSSPNDLNTNKYSVGNGNNTLTVKNVELNDAATYCCAYTPATKYCSNLVVMDTVTASINPSDGVQVGATVNLTCSVTYNAPPTDVDAQLPLSKDQDPQLSMFIGNNEIGDGNDGEEVVGTTTVPHRKTLSVNRTVEKMDAGQQLWCKVSTKNPMYEDEATADITVFAETRTAEIIYPNHTKNRDDFYPLNSTFMCRGDGYPPPDVEWLNGVTNKTFPESSGRKRNATWTLAKQGTYHLICAATDTRSRNTTYNATVVTAEGPQVAPTTTNKVGLGVGIGVGLGVPILIGLIVLIVILSRRKKKTSEPYPVKQPETKSKSPSTGKPPNGKNSDPAPGPRNNVNPNPNPSYTTPVMPEQTGTSGQKNVRDSPGYGDLGVRQIGGSGSNPHLNESFDSKANASFDSSRNYPPDGNFVIKPGRTSQSPSAPNTSV